MVSGDSFCVPLNILKASLKCDKSIRSDINYPERVCTAGRVMHLVASVCVYIPCQYYMWSLFGAYYSKIFC